MAARAIWKGRLALGKAELRVKMYSAVQDRKVHFRLLDADTLAPVHQRIVRKSDGKAVPQAQRRKAFALDADRAVMLTPKELDALEPKASRKIALCRFVAASLLSDQWYDRPYYLGPDEDEKGYFALVAALACPASRSRRPTTSAPISSCLQAGRRRPTSSSPRPWRKPDASASARS
jgi:DNA end-binding protein Ku